MHEKNIHTALSVIDAISYIMAFIELFIKHKISFGLFLTFISMALNFALWGMHNQIKLKNYIQKTIDVKEYPSAADKYFKFLTIIYIVIEIIALYIMLCTRYHVFVKTLLAVIIIPICYSCLTLGVKLYDVPKGSKYSDTQLLLACAPHAFLMIGTIISFNLFYIILGALLIGALGFPVYAVAEYIEKQL